MGKTVPMEPVVELKAHKKAKSIKPKPVKEQSAEIVTVPLQCKVHKKTKANRFDSFKEVEPAVIDRHSWPSEAVVYIGHLPHGFFEEQLRQYFSQYGEVLAVKVARSKRTARSKGYAFIQFKYAEIAKIVSDTMNGYLLMGKVLISHGLPANTRNPFGFGTSKQYKFIDWRRQHMNEKNRVKSEEEIGKEMASLLNKEVARKDRLKELGITYDYPGFASLLNKKKK